MGRAASAASFGIVGVLLACAPALGAGGDPPPIPRPDPPPVVKRTPPPPPVVPQPAPQPAAPPPPAVVITQAAPAVPAAAPRVVHPTAAERRAAVAKRRARAAARAHAAKRRLGRSIPVVRDQTPPLARAGSSAGSSSALPFLLVAFTAAFVMVGLAFTPARVVPWSRASLMLENHRDELAVLGVMSLVASIVFLALVQVAK
jgi:hypothetical protein